MMNNNIPVHELNLDEITVDERLQFRLGKGPYKTDPDTVERYSAAMLDGNRFPPLEVVELRDAHEDIEAGTLLLVGGFTRYCAAKEAGISKLDSLIRPGTWRDARCLAFRQNARHGKARTKEELLAILEAIRRDYPGITYDQIASMAECPKSTAFRHLNPKEEKTTTPQATSQPSRKELDRENTDFDAGHTSSAGSEEETDRPADDDEEVPPPDPHADLRAGRRRFLAIAVTLKDCLKEISDLKAEPSGARIKFGVCEKHIEEARRHIQNHCPMLASTDAAQEANGGVDFTDTLGWIHALGADRLGDDVKAACVKL
ncbi:hypothetical protein [Zavarzinella formosa]|uniref:hypothetical protein n=1 Tax=Zavarzinella formosa TaxID=360055 RepID=UPI00049549F2|nr:hypothetical protein [Zavarzinella formosa]